MLHFSKGKMISILLAVFIGFMLALPNAFDKTTTDTWPNWMPKSQINLGLDLQGGVHLQVQVQKQDIVEERLENLEGDVRQSMRDREQGPLGYAGRKRAEFGWAVLGDARRGESRVGRR